MQNRPSPGSDSSRRRFHTRRRCKCCPWRSDDGCERHWLSRSRQPLGHFPPRRVTSHTITTATVRAARSPASAIAKPLFKPRAKSRPCPSAWQRAEPTSLLRRRFPASGGSIPVRLTNLASLCWPPQPPPLAGFVVRSVVEPEREQR